MKTTYDIYNRLHQSSVTGVEYISDTNSIIYSTSEYSVNVCEVGKVFHVVLTYEGYEYLFTAPSCDNVYNLLSGLDNNEISINRLSDIYIKLQGYSNINVKHFSKAKAVILSAIGILIGLFSLMMCFILPIGSLLFDEKFDFSLMTVDLIFIATLLISISMVKYAVLQSKYKRRIWMVVAGYALIGFFSCTSYVMLIEDYDKASGYSVDTIGAFGVMLLGVLFGVVFLIYSKRNKSEKSLLLIRNTVLPDTADADAIFCYMEKLCSHGKLPVDEIFSEEIYQDDELDLFMKYSADKLSIPIDKTLTFDEFLTALSKDIADRYENSNVAKYYYYDEYEGEDETKKYILRLQVCQIDDRKILKTLSPVFIWAISIFVLLAIVCNAPQAVSIAAVLLMIIDFVMIIPIFIILCKKMAGYRKSQVKTINAEFEIKDDKIFLNGREVVITFFLAKDGFSVMAVSMLFDKFCGYALMDTEIKAFVKYAEENRFPINITGCSYPKNK